MYPPAFARPVPVPTAAHARAWRRGLRCTVARLLAGCSAALLLAGCGDPRRPAVRAVIDDPVAVQASAPAVEQPRITLILKALTNPYFMEMERGAREAQRQARAELQVKAATQSTLIERQIQLVHDAIKGRSHAIVIAPGDSTRLVPALKAAQEAGIHIVNLDNRLDPEAMAAAGMKPVPFIGVDNEHGAYLAARFLAEQVRTPSEAIIIEGERTSDNARQRKRGAQRGLRSNPDIRIVAEESAHWKIDEAYELTARLVKAHPKVKLVVCANDMMAVGAIKYLQESGRADVLVAGFDALGDVMPALRAGQLAATVDQQAARQGFLGIRTALQMLAGEAPAMHVDVDSRLVTAQSLK